MGHSTGADRLVQLIGHIADVTTHSCHHHHHHQENDHPQQDDTTRIDYVTLYGFSTENWQRSSQEIRDIFQVVEMTARTLLLQHQVNYFRNHFSSSTRRQQQQRRRPIQVKILGHLDDTRIPNGLRQALRELERATNITATSASTTNTMGQTNNNNNNNNLDKHVLTVCIAINYGGQQDITHACQQLAQCVASGALSPQDITPQLVADHLCTATIPHPDMIVRTSGECRLSNFLLWESAYTELYMTDTLWPDFDIPCWNDALLWYSQRQRRFGSRGNNQPPQISKSHDQSSSSSFSSSSNDTWSETKLQQAHHSANL
jgi:undecaprenyl diphosphate synthase